MLTRKTFCRLVLAAGVAACVAFAHATDAAVEVRGGDALLRMGDRHWLQDAVDAKAAAGGGEVVVPAGTHEFCPFVLKSGVTLRLERGAVLQASTNIADYAVRDGSPVLIGAFDATNVAVVGEGVIDGRGSFFKEKEGLPGESQPVATPVLMRLSRCRGVRLEDFTFRNAAAWGVHLRNCDGVEVRRIKAFCHVNKSNDGIDVESRNVLIEDCDLDTDDDALVFKSESDPSFAITNVEVRNCRLASCCNAIKFGTGSYGLWRDIDVHDCVVARAAKAWRFDWRKPSREHPVPSDAFPKPMPGVTNAVTGLSAIALEVVDGGRMESVKVRNIDIQSGFQTPIFIRMERRHPPADGAATYMRDVLIENVKGTAESRIACSITGLPQVRPTGITLRNVSLRFPGGGTAEEAAKVPRECETDYPDNYMFDQEALPAWGFYIRHADDIRFENVTLSLLSPDARPRIVREDVSGFSWDVSAHSRLETSALSPDEAVRIGVISDTHVTGPESACELERALGFFAGRGVDAVVHCGDVTDLGYLSQLDVFISSWRRMMPPGTPLVAAFGNRDMSDTAKIPADVKARDRNLLICSDPGAAMRRLCGWSGDFGVRAATVRGVPIVAADWRREGELEAFLSARPELRRAAAEKWIVSVQHPHPQGTVFGAGEGSWMADDGRATCYLRMFPRAWSFSGHSHIPFTTPFGAWRGEFSAVAAGSFYLGPPTAKGGREVSLLTLWRDRSELERRDLETGFCETTVFRRGGVASPFGRADSGEFVFAQWNIGHFSFGKRGDSDISVADAPVRAAAYRGVVDGIGADLVGVCEFSSDFDMGGGKARDLVFGSFRHFEAGPHHGYQCNAIASASVPLQGVSTRDYRLRKQSTYRIACEAEVLGKRTVIVETHLDLSEDERRAQLAELVAEFENEERVIVSGDFNVSHEDEYRPFLLAGFSQANCGRFGAYNTHRRRSVAITPAIDNVFVKGFSIRGVRTADDALELSDHRILVCRLSLK